jgi:serine/threonine protein kinase
VIPKAASLDDYELVRELGRGSFGVVYLARSIFTGEQVAIKKIPTEKIDAARREYSVTKKLGCLEHVLCYRDFIETTDAAYLIMDYLEGKDLFDILLEREGDPDEGIPPTPFSIPELLIMFEQLLIGVEALHKKGVAHMDLKVENVRATLLGGLVIIDLGMTCSLVSAPSCDLAYSGGTRETWSPEMGYAFMFASPRMSRQEFFASDIWMTGLIFKSLAELRDYSMLYVDEPSGSRDTYIRKWDMINALKPTTTQCDELNKIIDDMLKLRYEERPSAKILLDRIRHTKC